MIGVFPKGARFFRSPPTASGKTQAVSGSFHQEAMFMNHNGLFVNHGFVVQVSDDEGNDLGHEFIGQYVDPRGGERGKTRIRNQVEKHLFHRFRKTGQHYSIIFEGDPYQAQEIIEGRDGIPF